MKDSVIRQSEGLTINVILETLRRDNIYKKEFRYRTSEGRLKTFDSIFVPISDTAGEIVEILSMHHNITDLLELNQEIITTQHEVLLRLAK